MHVRRGVRGLPVPSEAGVALTAVVGVGAGQRQRSGVLVTGVAGAAHSVRIGKDPASHWNRQEARGYAENQVAGHVYVCERLPASACVEGDAAPTPLPYRGPRGLLQRWTAGRLEVWETS